MGAVEAVALAAAIGMRAVAASALRLPAVLSDGAVLQAGGPVPIWGWAAPRSPIGVRVAGQELTTRAGTDGRWQVLLDAVPAGPVGDLVVTDGRATVVSRDLLAGEVWICSGQSNMGFSVRDALHGADEVKAADFPRIRLFQQEALVSATPLTDTGARWRACTPESVAGFSAVGFFFGRELHRELNVPVGLINASWGGTNVECWTDAETLGAAKGGRSGLAAWRKRLAAEPRLAGDRWGLELKDVVFVPAGGGAAVPLAAVATTTEWNDVASESGATVSFAAAGPDRARLDATMRPAGWAQATRRLSAADAGVDCSRFSAVRFKVRGRGRFLVRITQDQVWAWEAHRSEPFTLKADAWSTVTVPFATLKQHEWAWQRPFNPKAVNGLNVLAESALGPNDVPTGLWNGQVAPVAPYGIRGAVWYQGENNAWMAERYGELFPAMIRGWRARWGRGDFPFLFVQLANWQPAVEGVQSSEWAELREAQTRTLSLTNTGMAVAIEVGDASDIHPKDKQSVGHRLALNALAKVYGRPVEFAGPTFDRLTVSGDAARIAFAHAAGLKARDGGKVTGFSVAGADRVWKVAEATVDGGSVILRAAGVPAPVAARYAWANNPVCNLVNGAGLPAAPFRTDDWPGVTAGR